MEHACSKSSAHGGRKIARGGEKIGRMRERNWAPGGRVDKDMADTSVRARAMPLPVSQATHEDACARAPCRLHLHGDGDPGDFCSLQPTAQELVIPTFATLPIVEGSKAPFALQSSTISL